MKIHALRTGTVAIKEKQRQGRGHGLVRTANVLFDTEWTEPLPIHAWLIEHEEGLILVDTGETARTAERGYFPAWHPYFRRAVRASVTPDEEIGPQLRARGFSPDDVRFVVLTHLHTDHAGGLSHFPKAEILVSRQEFAAASGAAGRLRGYLPQHFPAWFSPHLVDFPNQPFGTFERSLPLTRTGDVVLVATEGHSAGHLSVVVEEAGRSLFLAGDVSYTENLMLNQTVDGVSPREALARQTLKRVKEYTEMQPVIFLPSHDPDAVSRLENRTVSVSTARPQ